MKEKQSSFVDLRQEILTILNSDSNNKSKLDDTNIKENSSANEKTIDERTEKWNLNGKIVELFQTKINSDTKLKRRYAMALIIVLIGDILFLNIWFLLKGLGKLNFSDTTFNIFITGGLAEVFVLVKIIVKYLFNDNLTELLKLILDRNNKEENRKNYSNKYNKNSKNRNNEKKCDIN